MANAPPWAILLGLFFAVPLAILLGMRSAMREDRLFRLMQSSRRAIAPVGRQSYETNEFRQVTWAPGKVEVSTPALTPLSIVAFTFGQSNAANTGGEKYITFNTKITNFWSGKFYQATDPLLGASGASGSVWGNLAEKLIALGVADQVVIVSAAIGGTSISEWRIGGRLYLMLESRLIEAAATMIVTDFFWHQGEADNPQVNESGIAQYEEGLQEIICLTKVHFPESIFFVAIATMGLDCPASPALQAVQERVALLDGVCCGPKTDDIGVDDRYDGVHFSGRGIEKHANGWVAAIQAQRSR